MCVYLYLHIVFNDDVMIFSKHDVSPFLLYFHSIQFNLIQFKPNSIHHQQQYQTTSILPSNKNKYTKNTTNHKNQTKPNKKQTNIQKKD